MAKIPKPPKNPDFPYLEAKPSLPIKEGEDREYIENRMMDGSVHRRPRYTTPTKYFEVYYPNMHRDEYNLLTDFRQNILKEGRLTAFWKHPETDEEYVVAFDSISLVGKPFEVSNALRKEPGDNREVFLKLLVQVSGAEKIAEIKSWWD
ncbi:MAG: hypothetical protein KJ621_12100 [Proteobacteria bacterium]|nr:hypothetical protein [Pseudomonadota bacterium]